MRPSKATDNPYYISPNRYYELRHFCLQYPEWKTMRAHLRNDISSLSFEYRRSAGHNDPTVQRLILCEKYTKKIDLVEESAIEADSDIWKYLVTAVTKGHTYDTMRSLYDIPCGREMFYDRCRKFYWILSQKLQSII